MQYAEEHDYTVLEVVEDVTSGVAYDRPALWRVRRLVQAGIVDAVLIERWDRWSRGAVGLLELEKHLVLRGVSLEVCHPREIWLCEELGRHFWGQSTGQSKPPEFEYKAWPEERPMPTLHFGPKWKSWAS